MDDSRGFESSGDLGSKNFVPAAVVVVTCQNSFRCGVVGAEVTDPANDGLDRAQEWMSANAMIDNLTADTILL